LHCTGGTTSPPLLVQVTLRTRAPRTVPQALAAPLLLVVAPGGAAVSAVVFKDAVGKQGPHGPTVQVTTSRGQGNRLHLRVLLGLPAPARRHTSSATCHGHTASDPTGLG
jgi:hypothetical protein